MDDPIIEAARRAMDQACDTLRGAVGGMPVEALNWRPAGAETNSLAVLTTHAMYSTRLLLHMAIGLPLPPRDRPAEFAATAAGAATLLDLVDALAADCAAVLEAAGSIDWGTLRRRHRDDGSIVEMPAADALFHAVEHLRGHADEAALTRHVWLARS